MSKLFRKEYLHGISPCLSAILASRRKIYKVYLNEKLQTEEPNRDALNQIINEIETRDLKILYKSRSILDKLSGSRPHQNVVMHAGKLDYIQLNGREITDGKEFYLVLDKIHDPMNFGAIIRSAYYFGVDKIIVGEKECCGLTPTVSKASAGAMEWMPIHAVKSVQKFLKRHVSSGWDVIGTSGVTSVTQKRVLVPSNDVTIEKSTILVLGNEGFGMDEDIASVCTKLVTIPSGNKKLAHDIDSLNVSVATGILLSTFLRNR